MPDIGAIEPTALKARLDRGDRVLIRTAARDSLAELSALYVTMPSRQRKPLGLTPHSVLCGWRYRVASNRHPCIHVEHGCGLYSAPSYVLGR